MYIYIFFNTVCAWNFCFLIKGSIFYVFFLYMFIGSVRLGYFFLFKKSFKWRETISVFETLTTQSTIVKFKLKLFTTWIATRSNSVMCFNRQIEVCKIQSKLIKSVNQIQFNLILILFDLGHLIELSFSTPTDIGSILVSSRENQP